MRKKIVIASLLLSGFVWLLIYPIMLTNFVRGGYLQPELSISYMMLLVGFVFGFLVWAICLIYALVLEYGICITSIRNWKTYRKKVRSFMFVVLSLLLITGPVTYSIYLYGTLISGAIESWKDTRDWLNPEFLFPVTIAGVTYLFAILFGAALENEFEEARARGWVGLSKNKRTIEEENFSNEEIAP